jgi:PIN domain nuclease of toxin-antitoxin system
MTDVLIDSHVYLWLEMGDPRLGPRARSSIASATAVYVSAASVWELRIKHGLGKVALPDGFFDDLAGAGLRELPIAAIHARSIDPSALPHRDPFDLMLVTQAQIEGLTLITADRRILDAFPHAIDAGA